MLFNIGNNCKRGCNPGGSDAWQHHRYPASHGLLSADVTPAVRGHNSMCQKSTYARSTTENHSKDARQLRGFSPWRSANSIDLSSSRQPTVWTFAACGTDLSACREGDQQNRVGCNDVEALYAAHSGEPQQFNCCCKRVSPSVFIPSSKV